MKGISKLILWMCLYAMIFTFLGCEKKDEIVADDYLHKMWIPKNLAESDKDLFPNNEVFANIISVDVENEKIAGKDEFNYEPYLHKIWIPESWEGSDTGTSHDDAISFYITNIQNGTIKGRLFEGFIARPDKNLTEFSGRIENGVGKVEFVNKYGNEGEIELIFIGENEMQTTLNYIKIKDYKETVSMEGGSIYKPYNLQDEKDFITTIFSKETNIDSWGNVKLVVGRFDTTRAFCGVAYLTNEEGDILYRFQAPFRTGAWIEEGYVEDINGDGLLDVRLIERFDADDIEDAEWIFLQEEDGLFSDGELVYEEDEMSN